MLSSIVFCMNDLFIDEKFIENDMFNYVNIIVGKVFENEVVMV